MAREEAACNLIKLPPVMSVGGLIALWVKQAAGFVNEDGYMDKKTMCLALLDQFQLFVFKP